MTHPAPNAMPEEIYADDRSWYTAHPHMHPACYTLTRYIRSDLAPTSQWRDISTLEVEEYKQFIAWFPAGKSFTKGHWERCWLKFGELHILGSIKSNHENPTHWMPDIPPPTKALASLNAVLSEGE